MKSNKNRQNPKINRKEREESFEAVQSINFSL